MSAYYNEHDKGAAAWLRKLISRGLIAPGDVDERSAEELRELADWLAADDYAAQDRYRAAAYLRACADALDAGPVAWTQQDDEALEPDMQSAWISVQDRMPPDDTPVLVYVPGNEMLAFAIDQWQMQREAPLGWSSATIETGMGWGDHDYEDVSHWMPLTAPGHPLDPDDQGIVDEYDGLLRMIDEAMETR